jgi:hypothetical protein
MYEFHTCGSVEVARGSVPTLCRVCPQRASTRAPAQVGAWPLARWGQGVGVVRRGSRKQEGKGALESRSSPAGPKSVQDLASDSPQQLNPRCPCRIAHATRLASMCRTKRNRIDCHGTALQSRSHDCNPAEMKGDKGRQLVPTCRMRRAGRGMGLALRMAIFELGEMSRLVWKLCACTMNCGIRKE